MIISSSVYESVGRWETNLAVQSYVGYNNPLNYFLLLSILIISHCLHSTEQPEAPLRIGLDWSHDASPGSQSECFPGAS